MTMFYPNLCYNDVCYKDAALYLQYFDLVILKTALH